MTFLNDYLTLGHRQTILIFTLLILSMIFIYFKVKNGSSFLKVLVDASVLGIGLGFLAQLLSASNTDILQALSQWFTLFNSAYIGLLKLVVLPLVFLSILNVVSTSGSHLKSTAFKTIMVLTITTMIASILTIFISSFLPPIILFSVDSDTSITMKTTGTIIDMIKGIIPTNITTIFAEANLLAIIILAGLIGSAMRTLDTTLTKPFLDLVTSLYSIFRKLALMLMNLLPVILIPLIANSILVYGASTLTNTLGFIITLYICLAVMFVFHLLLIKFCGFSIHHYLTHVKEVLILAFTSRSSLGTLPLTMNTLSTKLHIPQETSSLVASFGANMGMNGCAGVYPTLIVVALANTLQISLNFSFYATLIVVVALSSIGIAGIPGAATMSIAVVLSGMGLAEYYPLIALVLAIDPILDMGRTLLNVNGTMTACIIANRLTKRT
ncbi:MAG: cation:dicarboxylate symporter family transporter [Anaerorhabdus sp.]